MTQQRYPLEAARTVRRQARVDAEQALSGEVAASRTAEDLWRAAEKSLRTHEQATRGLERDVRATEDGGGRAAEYLDGRRFLERRKQEAAKLQQHAKTAHEAYRLAEARVADARRLLTERNADDKVIEKHRDAWTNRLRKELDQKEEAEVEDLVSVRHGSRTP